MTNKKKKEDNQHSKTKKNNTPKYKNETVTKINKKERESLKKT